MHILTNPREALERFLHERNEPSYRIQQIEHWIFQRYALSFDAMTNLPQRLRQELKASVDFSLPIVKGVYTSHDGSEKYVFGLHDGSTIEGVRMPKEDRTTLCLSSQTGCPLGCLFCRTGEKVGRNLTIAEMYGHFLLMAQGLEATRLNVVFMGMGEPLLNLHALEKTLHHLYHSISPRRITVSTIGILSRLSALGKINPHPRLAVSLNGATDEVRRYLMPGAPGTIHELLAALDRYPRRRGEKVTLEYVMIKGITDTAEQLKAFILLLKERRRGYKVNLIPYNAIPGKAFSPSSEDTLERWMKELSQKNITVTLRRSMGGDVQGACGQLAGVTLSDVNCG